MMRSIGAWMLYGIGDLWCELFVQHGPGRYCLWTYRVYSQLMIWSVDLQGVGGNGPWKAVQETTLASTSAPNEAIADAEAGKVIESDFDHQMEVARRIMKQRRDALHELAKR